ncbi:MAG TPA: arginine deiminase-related protein, partial [Cryomorphaceae bacterium]|nr:arginine deiminase-related protein [Cryomorphaceae bacterium]
EITEEQVEHFAGNMLNVANAIGEEYCVMSSAAFQSLRPDQIDAIKKHAKILHSSLDTIEALGGGSARCMMAEIFLPKNNPS